MLAINFFLFKKKKKKKKKKSRESKLALPLRSDRLAPPHGQESALNPRAEATQSIFKTPYLPCASSTTRSLFFNWGKRRYLK
jgi:hypothetical protein